MEVPLPILTSIIALAVLGSVWILENILTIHRKGDRDK